MCEIGVEQPTGLGAVRVGRAVARLALRRDHRAKLQPGHQLVGRLVLQFLDPCGALQRFVVFAFEKIQLRQLAFELPQRRAVVDLVAGEHRIGVAAHVGRKAAEFRVVADDILDAAVDLVGEARQVGRFLDAGFRLRDRGGRDAKDAQQGQEASEHEAVLRWRAPGAARDRTGQGPAL